MSICYRREEQGFTLVEVMVSLAIFLVASMGILPLLLSNLQVNRGNSLHAQARRLAGEQLAKLQVVDYASLALLPEVPLLAGEIELAQHIEGNQPTAGLSRITVTAQWQQQGRIHRYQLQTTRSAP